MSILYSLAGKLAKLCTGTIVEVRIVQSVSQSVSSYGSVGRSVGTDGPPQSMQFGDPP